MLEYEDEASEATRRFANYHPSLRKKLEAWERRLSLS